MNFETLSAQASGGVLTLLIDRPKALNALNSQVISELHTAVERAQNDPEVHVIVLAGAGEKAFVAGADIKEMSAMTQDEAVEFARAGQAVVRLLAEGPKLSIAAVDGFALGGGCELAVACDWLIASEGSRFGQPEVKLGVIPGFGGTQRLTRRVGASRARYLVLSGDLVKAEDALALGLVDKVVERGQALETALAMAGKMTSEYSMLACRKAKEVIAAGEGKSLEEALELEAQAFGSMFTTHDQTEGMTAFLEKRPPRYEQ